MDKIITYKGVPVVWDTTPSPRKEPTETPIIEHIRNNETCEIRHYSTTGYIHDGDDEPHEFYWREGNMQCDCNRELHFNYAIGKAFDEIEVACSDGRFSVNVEWKGRIWYREFDD